jgi:hypothetical protein
MRAEKILTLDARGWRPSLTRLAAPAAVLALVLAPAALAQRMDGGLAPQSQWGAASCSGHGHTELGRCACDPRWSGAQCDTPEQPLDCGEHGKVSRGRCVCEPGWKGRTCQIANSTCTHGKLASGKCVCDPGWSGDACKTAAN